MTSNITCGIHTVLHARIDKIIVGMSQRQVFIWWANHVLQKCNWIIAKVRSHFWKRTHKFGVLIPKSVKEALLLDDKTGTDL